MFRTFIVLVLLVGTSRADLVSVGDYSTRPGTLDVPITISGGSELQSLALGLRVSDGTIAGITYDVGTIWEGLQLLTFEGVPLPSFETIGNVVINQINTGTTADGVAMWLTLDLSDVDPGRDVTLDLNASGLSDAADRFSQPIPLTFRSGTVSVVPEPSAGVLCGTVFCLGFILLLTGRVFA